MSGKRTRRGWLAAVLGGLLGLTGLGLAARLVLFSGPYQVPAPIGEHRFVDLHVHTAGIGAGDSGCLVSKEMENSYKFGIYLKAFGVTREEVAERGDALLLERIAQLVAASTNVSAAVVLALDGVVDETGELDRTRTEILVPDAFVARETAKYTNLLFGASIHPYRRDALERLDWAAAHGAVLVKWIPSIMLIDPADERLIPFYERLKFHGLPLLTHTGEERSFTFARDELADPERLRLPLRLGVTVIAAHVASNGETGGEPNLERLARLMPEYPRLYADISSLTQANRRGDLRQVLERPEFAGRLAYGSDFPLINTALVSPWYYPLNLTREAMARLAAIENPWDRDVALKQALGLPAEVFERSGQLVSARRALIATPIDLPPPAENKNASRGE